MGLLAADASSAPTAVIPMPKTSRPVLLSCKMGMIAREVEGKKLGISDRLKMAAEAGFDGVDFDEAGSVTAAEVREAVRESGVFVHNAINHTQAGRGAGC